MLYPTENKMAAIEAQLHRGLTMVREKIVAQNTSVLHLINKGHHYKCACGMVFHGKPCQGCIAPKPCACPICAHYVPASATTYAVTCMVCKKQYAFCECNNQTEG